ncbi:MAG TPA: helix-turn-helix transcriptional regulator [Candidatus Egerieicola faecale]|uniref:Helix-turn-helix transcriptional regulator n=1 Tax=Candidatus Egerieicola faecale TaxID=2840774 RepID=A0A9D1IS11_9FIRM|nr:helix-turn-helix transcriptional regulator [Candidatus Egerieicola faecale]
MTFCQTLRSLIEERGITQKQLARDLKIPVSTLGGYVQGTSEPDFETLKLIARYFRVSSDYLLHLDFGEGNTDLERELLRIFRSLNTQEQALYLEQGKAFLKLKARNPVNSSLSLPTKNSNAG